MPDSFFRYRFDQRFTALLLPFGVRAGRDGVRLSEDGRFRATFGFLRLDTPIENVVGGHVTSGYRWYAAIGARLSFVDDGLTFGTSTDRGVCVHFRQPVGPVLGSRAHSALTVTVEDCDGLVQMIGSDAPRT